MQLRAEQLEAHLAKSLAALYTIHGDEPLLALEAADAVRAAARRSGCAEREVLSVERSFDWSGLAHAPFGREREDLLLAHFLGEFEPCLGLLRVIDHRGAAAGADAAPEFQRNGAAAWHVDAVERQLGHAAQLEAASGDQHERKRGEGVSHTTMLIRRPGTTITLRIAWPPAAFLTRSLARANASRSLAASALGAFSDPFFLPFSCTT